MKTKPWVGLNARPDALCSPVTRIRSPQVCLLGITWPHRDGSFVGITSHGVTTDCHSRGGAKQLYGVGRPSLTQRPTVADRRRRPRNLSVPPDRLLKTMARPPKGDRSAPGTRGGIETPVEPLPRDSGVGAVSLRLGRRAASVFACE